MILLAIILLEATYFLVMVKCLDIIHDANKGKIRNWQALLTMIPIFQYFYYGHLYYHHKASLKRSNN